MTPSIPPKPALFSLSILILLYFIPIDPLNRPPHGSRDLIVDLGLNTGGSTRRFLSLPRNFRVVAVEANPRLIDAAMNAGDLAPHLRNGRLKLVHAAIRAEKDPPGNATFYVNRKSDQWSSFIKSAGCRTGQKPNLEADPPDSACFKVSVPTISCAELLRTLAAIKKIYYLKIDIEGMDYTCLSELARFPVTWRPKFVSIEEFKIPPSDWTPPRKIAARKPVAAEYAQQALLNLSYHSLKRVAQHGTEQVSSGEVPWESRDVLNGNEWSSYRPAELFDDLEYGKWFDWHGMLDAD